MSGQVIAGRYRLHSVLGRGGMATVWRGVDERLGRPVAVKLLNGAGMTDPAARLRFDREARTAAHLAHPNIVTVHDVGHDHDVPYLVMELVDGTTLAARLAGGPLPIDQAINIAAQVCDALTAAHAAGVVHRDVKPGNILLSGTGTVKVCDYGIARLTHQQQATLTGPHTTIGTSAYMAPEQSVGGTVDGRTDLYALGCVLYAMLTGAAPFTGDNPLAVLWQHQHELAPPVTAKRPETPAHLQQLMGRLLAKNPADRPPTAAHVRAALTLPPDADTAGAVRGAAPLMAPTRTLPLGHGDATPATAGRRLRLGPAGIAAVAVGVAILATLTVGLLSSRDLEAGAGSTAGQQSQPVAAPTPSAISASPTADTYTNQVGSTGTGAAELLVPLRATIAEQQQAGNLDNKAARDLTRRADEVARELDHGDADKAAEELGDLRDKVTDLYEDEKITPGGYDAVLASLDQLAAVLPAADRDDDEDG